MTAKKVLSASKIFHGQVWHSRKEPVPHKFSYPYKLLLLDIDQLSSLDGRLALFRYNRKGVLSIYDQDYLGKEPGGLREKVEQWFFKEGLTALPTRILLLTAPRYLGYVFNPVSFFYCFGSQNQLLAVLAQVNNTFGDSHLYFLHEKRKAREGYFVNFLVDKKFHVSPFNDMSGQYDFSFNYPEERLKVGIDIIRSGKTSFCSGVEGELKPLSRWSLCRLLCSYPVQIWLAMPRILWQAAKLYYLRRLKVYDRPNPISEYTFVHRAPKWQERLAMRGVFLMLEKIQSGSVVVSLPSGEEFEFVGQESAEPVARLEVKNYQFFLRLALAGDVGAGESFMDGDWDSPDLTRLLEVLGRNQRSIEMRNTGFSIFSVLSNRLLHLFRPNSLRGSKKNIRDHYDLGNELFKSFLDSTMTYSCGIFKGEQSDLQDAQIAKLDEIIKKADIRATDTVLEIGCGWGSFAVRAAETRGCKVVCVTLSEEQYAFALERVEKLGLSDLIEIHLKDYRLVTGQFDKIVSIEMVEAVGEKFLSTFFEHCNSLLKPGGRLVIQAITLAEQREEEYRKGCDWIQKYIFPGCFVPSVRKLQASATKSTELCLERSDNIGIHYATTLAEWRKRFIENRANIALHGAGEDFIRKWIYYFGYCEAGFRSRLLGTHQMVFSRMDHRV